ncbi:vasorin isoform X1 [Sarcophilus harrisii]|nr:vasorin isoform X1 [Sarcophilus harrisii]
MPACVPLGSGGAGQAAPGRKGPPFPSPGTAAGRQSVRGRRALLPSPPPSFPSANGEPAQRRGSALPVLKAAISSLQRPQSPSRGAGRRKTRLRGLSRSAPEPRSLARGGDGLKRRPPAPPPPEPRSGCSPKSLPSCLGPPAPGQTMTAGLRKILLPPPLLLLLLLCQGAQVQGCPAGCQCNQPQTVFCIARKGTTVPHDVPPDTADLYVFENGITTLDSGSFVGLPALQLLDLSQNQIAILQGGVFQPLANLSNLDLSSNQLQEITNETFRGLRLLERLYLSHNRIHHIQVDAFDTLESLLELKLEDNQLHVLPPLRLPRLLLLDLSHNRIPALEAGTFGMSNIESLKLAGLGLSRLEEELFAGLRNLHELDVSENQLEAAPAMLRGLRGLTRLTLAGNTRITQLLPDDLEGLTNLQVLDLSNLSLQGLPRDFFSRFPRLREVTAARNPFNCVCQLSWFGQWARESRVMLWSPDETRCHFPPKNAGKLLQHLDYADFGCPATTTTATTARPSTPWPTLPLTSLPPVAPSTQVPTAAPPGGDGPSPPSAAAPTGSTGAQPEGCPAHTCLNGGTCRLSTWHHLECLCPEGFSGLYCEAKTKWPTEPPPTRLPVRVPQLGIEQVSATALRVRLKNYTQNKAQLKGLRLTYRNLSGPDKRPVTLSLPATLSDYTVTQLRPNATYSICIGPLGGARGPEGEEACGEARTAPSVRYNHAPVTQGKEGNLPLMIVPALAALLLGVLAAAGAMYCLRRRQAQDKARGQRGAEAGPMELGGVKAPLEDPGSKVPEGGGVPTAGSECEVPLMHYAAGNNNRAPVPKPSYF